jgi:hypothetical protein
MIQESEVWRWPLRTEDTGSKGLYVLERRGKEGQVCCARDDSIFVRKGECVGWRVNSWGMWLNNKHWRSNIEAVAHHSHLIGNHCGRRQMSRRVINNLAVRGSSPRWSSDSSTFSLVGREPRNGRTTLRDQGSLASRTKENGAMFGMLFRPEV